MMPRALIAVGVMYYRRRLELALYRNKQIEGERVQLVQRVSELEKLNLELGQSNIELRQSNAQLEKDLDWMRQLAFNSWSPVRILGKSTRRHGPRRKRNE